MSTNYELARRTFLKSAGVVAAVVSVSGRQLSLNTSTPPSGQYDFDTPYPRFGTDSVKYDRQIGRYGKDSIQVGMGVADMDLRTAPAITKALMERMQHENWGYLETPSSFTESIVAWNKRRYGVEIDPNALLITTGVDSGLVAALKTFAPRGSKVLLNTPTYDGFFGDLAFTGNIPNENPLTVAAGRYSIDFKDFERRISSDTKAFILCNPQNPTGNCWAPEDLMRLGEICLRHKIVVLADEIHCDFVTKGSKYHAVCQSPEQGSRQQQRHLQVGQQVVQHRGHEVRMAPLDQRRPHRKNQSEQPCRLVHHGNDRQPRSLHRRRGLARPVRGVYR